MELGQIAGERQAGLLQARHCNHALEAASAGDQPQPERRACLPEQLAVSVDEFLVFTNASNQRVAVLYRRRDGNYGLIEAER